MILTENTGELLETLVCDHLLRLSFRWNNYAAPQVYYWTGKNEQEVDFVVKTERFGASYLPIEVKSGDTGKLKGIKALIKEKSLPFGIVITKNRLEYDVEEKIIYVPIVYFLLLC
jgi:predicted AAA+ superfamily ATPase